MTPKEYFCNTCNAGPWTEDATGSDGKSIVRLHRKLKHDIVEYLEPKVTINEYAHYTIKYFDEMLHDVIASYKPDKVCLIKDKWQFLYPIGQKFTVGRKL